MTAGLELAQVTLTLGDGDAQVRALDAVSLTVGAGELVAVIGPSGSGKSSLLAVAGLLIRPTAGAIAIGGRDVCALTDKDRTALRRERVGFVFQSANLLPSLTARDQLLLVRHLDGRIRAQDRGRAEKLLASVGMSHRAGRRPHQLSGGERQRVGIARALMTVPDVLLVDEPTSALDHERAHEVVNLLAQETHEQGVATVMVTHDPAILGQADRVVRIADGRIEG